MELMFENVRLIASDIDGTLLDKSKEITPATRSAIEALRDKGMIFGLASGRPAEDVLKKYEEWGIREQFDFIIGWNGAQLYDARTGQIETFNYLKKEWLHEIVDAMKDLDGKTDMYLPGVFLSDRTTEKTLRSVFHNKRKLVVASDPSDFYQQDNGGIMFRYDMEQMPAVEKRLQEINAAHSEYIGFKTQPDIVEFSNIHSNKGYALKKYCEKYAIDLENCMAFGDTSNDNEMLKCCHGICLKNGSDDTKACAEMITDKTIGEDGFADFAGRFLLNR